MFIFSNLATSMDGKIADAKRGFFPLGTALDRRTMHVLRRRADAVLVGASTLRAFKRPMRAQGASNQPINIIVSSRLEGISPSWAFFKTREVRRILFASKKLSTSQLKAFKKSSEIFFLKTGPSARPRARQIINTLEDLGIKKLLIEGGGGIMWDFASLNLIDEYYLTLTPRILGGTDAPTMVEGHGFGPFNSLKLKLKRCRRIDDEVYLVYQRIRNGLSGGQAGHGAATS